MTAQPLSARKLALAHKPALVHRPVHNSESCQHRNKTVQERSPAPALLCIHWPARTTAVVVQPARELLRQLVSELSHAKLTRARQPCLKRLPAFRVLQD